MSAHTGRSIDELAVYFHQSPHVIAFSRGLLSPEAFAGLVGKELGFAGTFDEFRTIWCEIFDPMEDMLSLASNLKGRYPRIILSNTNALHVEYICRQYPVMKEFDGLVFSNLIGLLKPDVKIYEYTCRQYGLEPARTVLIDDLPANIEGARQAGLQGILCLNFPQVRQELTKLGVPFI